MSENKRDVVLFPEVVPEKKSKKKWLLLLAAVLVIGGALAVPKVNEAKETKYKKLLQKAQLEEWANSTDGLYAPGDPIFEQRLEDIVVLQEQGDLHLFDDVPASYDATVGVLDWMQNSNEMIVNRSNLHWKWHKESRDKDTSFYSYYYTSRVDLNAMTDESFDIAGFKDSDGEKPKKEIDFVESFGFDYRELSGADCLRALFDYCGFEGYENLDGSKLDKEYYYEWGQKKYFLPTDSRAFDELKEQAGGNTIVDIKGTLTVGEYKGDLYPGYINICVTSEDDDYIYHDFMYAEIQFDDGITSIDCDCGCCEDPHDACGDSCMEADCGEDEKESMANCEESIMDSMTE